MSNLYAKYFLLNYNNAEVIEGITLKSNYLSLRLIKESSTINPKEDSKVTNILLNGKCIDKENRKLYLFYIDKYYNSAWIIEIDIDTRAQVVVYFDRDNKIGFNPDYKIYNAKVVYGRIIWTDNLNPIYQIDIERAKRSFAYGIGYNENENITQWNDTTFYAENIIVYKNKYFFKCIQANTGQVPEIEKTYWSQLCIIEDAYFSMKIENFYFAPTPPKLAPVVTYISDAGRAINNLKQTLFQFAYNYVYMDYRESTFSPACIVALPQAEEEPTTGHANEDVSLNNAFKIEVNTGGEEVRKVKIIGRSNQDPQKWFLVEEIDKFSDQEPGIENAHFSIPGKLTCSLTLPQVSIIMITSVLPGKVDLSLIVPDPVNGSIFLASSLSSLTWAYDEFDIVYPPADPTIERSITISLTGVASASLISIPSFLSVYDFATSAQLLAGAVITNGQVLILFPNVENTIETRTLNMLIREILSGYDNELEISCTFQANPLPLTNQILVHPLAPDGLTISSEAITALVGSNRINFQFTPNCPIYGDGVSFTMHYDLYKNGVSYQTGTFSAINRVFGRHVITLPMVTTSHDVYILYVWEGTLI
jgi:hypothetical protein